MGKDLRLQKLWRARPHSPLLLGTKVEIDLCDPKVWRHTPLISAHVLCNSLPLRPCLLPRFHLGLGAVSQSGNDTSRAGSVSFIRDGFHLIWVPTAVLAYALLPRDIKLFCRRILVFCVVLAGETVAWDNWCRSPRDAEES